ncbi:hypothetical protein AYL99_11613 [Fonsecaea erecta]|uniref:Uncharacterized protein n=1 Tax=Fonsecaea erecta TaxID=1367422 RepID=A0A178Z2Q2_9EURO|nr:hypothetical protein AYL99_11613 [Fonsecaea erecta]OAP54079.1 hypothetical protein AYL99_11613 [Fonsecaea erecta]
MVSTGGRRHAAYFPTSTGCRSGPWTGTPGVFDITAFEWVDRHDAAAAAYEDPDVVKRYYSESYKEPTWSDPRLATIFAFTPPAVSSTNGSTPSSGSDRSSYSSGGGNGGGDSSTATSSSSRARKSNAGATVGGVIGGVALRAVILGPCVIRIPQLFLCCVSRFLVRGSILRIVKQTAEDRLEDRLVESDVVTEVGNLSEKSKVGYVVHSVSQVHRMSGVCEYEERMGVRGPPFSAFKAWR